MRHPLVPALMLYVLGLSLGHFFHLSPVFALVAVLVLLGGYASLVWRRKFWRDNRLPPRGWLLFGGFVLIGLWCQSALDERWGEVERRALQAQEAGRVSVSGRLAQPAERRDGDRWVLGLEDVQVHWDKGGGDLGAGARVTIAGVAAKKLEEHPPSVGDLVKVWGNFHAAQSAEPRDEFDYRAYLKRRGLAGWITVWIPGQLHYGIPTGGASWWDRCEDTLARAREWMARRAERFVGEKQTPLLRALLLGETSGLTRAERQPFIDLGMAHLFSVSGLHVGMVVFLLHFGLGLLGIEDRLRSSLTFVGLLFYTGLVGFCPPVVRALLLGTAWLASNIFGRKVEGLNVLAASALVVLLLDPGALEKPDFQMSYLAVFALFTVLPILHQKLRLETDPEQRFFHLRRWTNRLVIEPFCVTLAAQLGLLPVVAIYYHQVSIIGLIANVIGVGLSFGAIVLGMLFFTFGLVGDVLAVPLGWAISQSLGALAWVVSTLRDLPLSVIPMRSFPVWAAGLYYLIFYSGPYLREPIVAALLPRHWSRFVLHVGAAMVFLVLMPLAARPAADLRLVFFDVGQGDSCLLRFASGETMLIDGGPNFSRDAGKAVVIPYLRREGIDSLSAVVVSHAQADHFGGLISVLQDCLVDLVIEGPDTSNSKSYQTF
ncbi:MAG: ComEC/Rec2 family competence protein, partial [bacterium]